MIILGVAASGSAASIDTTAVDIVATGAELIAGIRPENIGDASKARGAAASIDTTVDIVEPIGHESIVYASAGDERLVAIFDPKSAPRVGQKVALAVDVDAMHLFDGKTGQRIG